MRCGSLGLGGGGRWARGLERGSGGGGYKLGEKRVGGGWGRGGRWAYGFGHFWVGDKGGWS